MIWTACSTWMFFIFCWRVGGQKFESNPIIWGGYTKSTAGPFLTLQKKLSSAHSIRSCPSSKGATWVPGPKGSHSELHVSKKRTKFTGALRRFLGTTTKICQGFFISQTLKTYKNPLEKLTIGYRKITMFHRKYIDPFRVHFPASQRDTPGNEVNPRSKQTSKLPTKRIQVDLETHPEIC